MRSRGDGIPMLLKYAAAIEDVDVGGGGGGGGGDGGLLLITKGIN